MDYNDAKSYSSSTEAMKAKLEEFGHQPWWLSNDDARGKVVTSTGRELETNSEERHQANLRHTRLYENVDLTSFSPSDYAASVIRQALLGYGVMSLNVVASCIDTLAAKIAKNKPRPAFLTSGGSWDQQRKSKNLDKFMRGHFYETKVYEKGRDVFFDACIVGTGMLYVYESKGRLCCERVFPDEVFVDVMDGHYRKPRQIFRRKWMHKEVLAAAYPKLADKILALAVKKDNNWRPTNTNMVEVWECWHLPSEEGAGDGMHCIAVEDIELFCEEWKATRLPFVSIRFKNRTSGFWGKGVSETLTSIQVELNRLIRSVSEQLRRKGRGRIFLPMGSKVNPDHLTNAIGDIVWFNGQPPVMDNNNAVAAEEFLQIDRLYQRAFQEVGVSELSAAAKKPSGLDAAVALREFSDIESERFSLVHLAWEQFFLDYAELSLELLEKQYGMSAYKVQVPSKRFLIEVDWKDIKLSRNAYVMQMYPVSSLPQTPGARLQRVEELKAGGYIDQTVAKKLLDFPDIEAEMSLGNAAIEDVDATISAILDDETPTYHEPDPYQDLKLIMERATAAYLYARHHGCSEDRLELLRRLIDAAAGKVASMQAPAPGMMPGGAPPMLPAPPPGLPAGGSPVNVTNTMNGPPTPPLVPPVVG